MHFCEEEILHFHSVEISFAYVWKKKYEKSRKVIKYCIFFHIILGSDKQNWTECLFNPLRPNNDVSQTSHCNIKGVSISEVMRIENMITQVQFYWYFNSSSPLLLYEMYGNTKGEFVIWHQGLKD